MLTIQLSATPKGNGYQATVTVPDGVSVSSEETYPTIAEAITAAAIKLLDMPERLANLKEIGARSAHVGEVYQHVAMARERCAPANEIAAAQLIDRIQ